MLNRIIRFKHEVGLRQVFGNYMSPGPAIQVAEDTVGTRYARVHKPRDRMTNGIGQGKGHGLGFVVGSHNNLLYCLGPSLGLPRFCLWFSVLRFWSFELNHESLLRPG